jgi:hypothetical protein
LYFLQDTARVVAGVVGNSHGVAQSGASIVDMGGPLGKTKRASREGISDTKNGMTGDVILEAGSHAAAARLFENHPRFAIFPGESVEIMEILPMPRQQASSVGMRPQYGHCGQN